MILRTAHRASLVDQVIDQLKDQITSGAWAVGDKIPPEPVLSDGLGVGRNTVREAVRALTHAGLLECRQGDGTYVRATCEMSEAVRRRLRTAELVEVLEVRRLLEMEAARLAAMTTTSIGSRPPSRAGWRSSLRACSRTSWRPIWPSTPPSSRPPTTRS